MKKAVIIFVLAVLLPAVLLGYLSLQSARQQGVLIEDQEARLRQQQADVLAGQVALAVRVEHEQFVRIVNELEVRYGGSLLSQDFNRLLPQSWNRNGFGFSVAAGGNILSPRISRSDYRTTDPAEKFILDNAAFIEGAAKADVYNIANSGLQELQQQQLVKQRQPAPLARKKNDVLKSQEAVIVQESFADADRVETKSEGYAWDKVTSLRKVIPQKRLRTVEQKVAPPEASSLQVTRSTFQDLTESEQNGIITRFVNDRLEILFWTRLPGQEVIYGARLYPDDLHDVLKNVIQDSSRVRADVVVALLDDRARPFSVFPPMRQQLNIDWKQPFVASEVGEVLPHWEVALYLMNPERMTRMALLSTWTISGLIFISLCAILFGGWMIMADTRRQLELARKKTDFVSNVSHELKTPLTSIRMFAELLRDKRVDDKEKERTYLNIITVEAERLTRLINNVLDFSRMERNQKTYRKESLDLHALLQTVWSGQELHLQQEGFQVQWHAEEGPYPIYGDPDAISQILVNLISNAEKYAGETKSIEVHSYRIENTIRVAVMDRGIGVPVGEEKKIFDRFYRAHDSLDSGIEGSGLGLTLAMRIAQDHGGNITFERREGGGSRFVLELPLDHRV